MPASNAAAPNLRHQVATSGQRPRPHQHHSRHQHPAQAAPLQPVRAWKTAGRRVVLASLWTALIAAAILFVYPLWPAAVYRWQQLHPDPHIASLEHSLLYGSTTQPGAGSGSPASPNSLGSTGSSTTPTSPAAATATADDQIPINGNRVIIPAIGVNTPIIEGSSLKVLDQHEGIWHQTGNVTGGNLVLAGHRFRYFPPNTTTLYDLNQLKPGDLIAVDWLGKRTVYKVFQMETVPASDVSLLNPTAKPRLTLYSCADMQETQRIVALAAPLPHP